jgi:hypothetical protein
MAAGQGDAEFEINYPMTHTSAFRICYGVQAVMATDLRNVALIESGGKSALHPLLFETPSVD